MGHSKDYQSYKANQTFIRTSMDQPLLTREQEHELACAFKDKQDIAALHKLVTAYGRLVIAMAGRFRHYGLPMADLIQEGNIGLLLAAMRFEPEREVRFSTYAAWWVRSALQDYVLRNWSIVRTGVTASHKSLFFNLRRMKAGLVVLSGESETSEATRKKIAEQLGVSLADVTAMEQRLSCGDQSLNAPLGPESEESWQSLLADDRPNPEETTQAGLDHAQRSRWLEMAMQGLSPREQIIIRERQLSDDGITLEQMGQELGVSKERVRQLEARAMGKLKARLIGLSHSRSELLGDI